MKLKKEREQGTYNSFRRINVDKEVLHIVDEDPTYHILFDEFYITEVPQRPLLNSAIDSKKYEQVFQLRKQK